MTELSSARNALDRFHDRLLPVGMLAMSIWYVMRDGPAEWSDWYPIAEKERPEDGKIVRRQERSIYDHQTHLRHTENRYELLEDGRMVYREDHRRSPELRDYTPEQISDMLSRAGFIQIKAVSGYTSEPAAQEDRYFFISGQKA